MVVKTIVMSGGVCGGPVVARMMVMTMKVIMYINDGWRSCRRRRYLVVVVIKVGGGCDDAGLMMILPFFSVLWKNALR